MSSGIFVAKSADVVGDVTVGDNSSLWYQTVLRGDQEPIVIGENSNIQDGTVIHCDSMYPTTIGDNVSVGHNCTLHGCTVSDNVIVGMGSIVLNGAVIGENSIIGAGSLVTQNKEFEPGKLILGSPAKAVRDLTEEEIASIKKNAEEYMELKELETGQSVYEDQYGKLKVRA